METRPPLPPFSLQTAIQKVRLAEDGWNSRDPARVALEAYPGLLARSVLGARSYKSDDRARQTAERLLARKDLLHALELGTAPLLGVPVRLHLTPAGHGGFVLCHGAD